MRITRGSSLYVNDAAGVTVLSGQLQDSGTPIAIKEQIYSSLARANQAIKESFTMVQVQHPYIVKVHFCEIEEAKPTGYKSIIVMELMDSDLYKRIEYRKRHQIWWSEGELMGMLVRMVQALSYAQQRGISHRDIKPQNIFVSADESVIKIGDFGSVCSETIDGFGQRGTITGSPLFLSPQLKNSYITLSQNRPGYTNYNQYKSDVYSLGVTFMYMATLDSPTGLTDLPNLQQNTEMLLGRLTGYPTLQWFLRAMLVIEEEARVDFVTLEQYMLQYGICEEAGGQIAGGNGAQSQQEQAYSAEYYQQSQQAPYPADQYVVQPPQAGNMYSAQEESKFPPSQMQQTSGYEATLTERKCHGCLRPFANCLNAENYPPSQKELVLNCCSEQCVQRLLHPQVLRPEELVECVKCKATLEEQRIRLNCGHCFHNKDCVFDYIRYISENFKTFLKFIPCPKCPMNTEEYNAFIAKAFKSRDEYEKMKDDVIKLYCVKCRTTEDLILWECGHRFCSFHYKKCTFCPICDKRSYESRPRNRR